MASKLEGGVGEDSERVGHTNLPEVLSRPVMVADIVFVEYQGTLIAFCEKRMVRYIHGSDASTS